MGGQLIWALCLSGNPPLCVLMLSVLQLYCCIMENKPYLSLSQLAGSRPNSITLSGSKLVRSRSPTSFEPASVMEFGLQLARRLVSASSTNSSQSGDRRKIHPVPTTSLPRCRRRQSDNVVSGCASVSRRTSTLSLKHRRHLILVRRPVTAIRLLSITAARTRP